ncbi:hypothetical protein GRF59_14510 [Paenibacillus sp. HJL G12]|uniref:Uncharacterized protein n=1 Tax=Paenibacillus dendrobii TaxID=2691084 RepID=A0A7X3IJG6_9BACL|nr:hypothetical protein [Paenibacillus dendrobii]MWV44830.1 hypothetical protein [Paenibacillus dendrobii]
MKEKLMNLLEQLEFCVYDGPNYDRYSCPSCYMPESNGHSEDCLLASCLVELKQRTEF